MKIKDFLNRHISNLFQAFEQQGSLNDFYKGSIVATYVEAQALAIGKQRRIISVTSDVDTDKNGKYYYEGSGGLILSDLAINSNFQVIS